MKTTIYLSENSSGIDIFTINPIDESESARIAEQLLEAQIDPNRVFAVVGKIGAGNDEIDYLCDPKEVVAAQQSA